MMVSVDSSDHGIGGRVNYAVKNKCSADSKELNTLVISTVGKDLKMKKSLM